MSKKLSESNKLVHRCERGKISLLKLKDKLESQLKVVDVKLYRINLFLDAVKSHKEYESLKQKLELPKK